MLVGTAMTGTLTNPPTTDGSAPSIPAATITTREFCRIFAFGENAVNSRDAGIPNAPDLVAHCLGGECGFLGHRDVARSGCDDGDLTGTDLGRITHQPDHACGFVPFCLGIHVADLAVNFSVGTSDQDVRSPLDELFEDPGDLIGRFALAEYHFRKTLPLGPGVIDAGKTDVFKRKTLDLIGRVTGGDRAFGVKAENFFDI